MEWIFNQLRERPELAIFLTIFLGFWLGKLRIGKFTLGTVTSVLLVGVLVGQLNIAVPGPIKSVFFLLFLFAVGYKVGPQFFRGLKKDGLPQVGFAVLMCVSVLLVTWLLALMMGYNAGEAAGLLAGSQTISAVIGVAEDTMANMGLDEAQRQSYVNIIPVSYAVTYIFGTAGSAWVLSSIGPKMLGGLEKVKAACKELEAKMGSSLADEPGFMPAARPVTFRAYRVENEWFKKWKEIRLKWHKALGFGDDHYRYHDHEKLAHYANAATDIEFLMPFGFKEVEGIHSRTNFDLSQHEKFSGKSIKYFDPEINESYTPYVIETSIGVDRMFLSIMSASYCEEKLENGETRVVLKLPAALAPVKLAIMPLVKKDGLPEKAREIMNDLKFHFHCQYDEKDSIGKRYRRQDAIGTPYCITIDHQTLEDNCVTLRNRDTMEQERVAIADLNNIIADKVSITSLLKTLQ